MKNPLDTLNGAIGLGVVLLVVLVAVIALAS